MLVTLYVHIINQILCLGEIFCFEYARFSQNHGLSDGLVAMVTYILIILLFLFFDFVYKMLTRKNMYKLFIFLFAKAR